MTVKDVTYEEAQQILETNKLVLIDFYGSTCAPCKALLPFLEKVAEQYDSVETIKICVDTEEGNAYAKSLNIQGVPTLIAYKGNEEFNRVVGMTPPSKLKELFENLSNS